MNKKILVTYATKYGSTKEIAEKIGQIFQQHDLQPEVLPVKQVGDLSIYGAVVLGSAVYIGQWRRTAVKFLRASEDILAQKPVWLFSSGPTGEGDPLELLDGWRFPPKLEPLLDAIQPRDIALFHGNVDVNKLNFLHKWMIGKVESPVGDFRDWDTIKAWAESIIDALNEAA